MFGRSTYRYARTKGQRAIQAMPRNKVARKPFKLHLPVFLLQLDADCPKALNHPIRSVNQHTTLLNLPSHVECYQSPTMSSRKQNGRSRYRRRALAEKSITASSFPLAIRRAPRKSTPTSIDSGFGLCIGSSFNRGEQSNRSVRVSAANSSNKQAGIANKENWTRSRHQPSSQNQTTTGSDQQPSRSF